MDTSQRCFLLCLYFGQLIAGVSRNKPVPNNLKEVEVEFSQLTWVAFNILHFKDESFPEIEIFDDIHLEEEIRRHRRSIPLPSKTKCPPYDSCVSRCGNASRGFLYTCNCDSRCSYFGDCCVDFKNVCKIDVARETDRVEYEPKPNCELLFETFPIFMVSKCPQDYNTSLVSLCHSPLPVQCLFPELSHANQDCEAVYYPKCWNRLSTVCDAIDQPQCSKLIANECKKLTATVCKNCNKSYWPAFGDDNILYQNSYCAKCNFQVNYTIPNLKSFLEEIQSVVPHFLNDSYPIRRCFAPTIDKCALDTDPVLSVMCSNMSGPVMDAVKSKNKKIVYKNIYCAQCHNKSVQDLKCASWTSIRSTNHFSNYGKIKPLGLDFITKEGQGLKQDDIPAAFSMLLNFGLDGRQRVYISSEGEEAMREHQLRCKKGLIWDPFSKVCRKLHCSTEFVLVDYECIRKEVPADDIPANNDTADIPDVNSNFAHLTLSVEMELIDFLQFNGQDLDKISETIRESFSISFNIHMDRIRNVRFNISFGKFESKDEILRFLKEIDDESHPITFTIDLDLFETAYVNITKPEPTVDSIVSMLASALSTNGFEFGFNNITGRIFEMQQTVDFIKSWCSPEDGGRKREYWNSEFKLILSENTSLSAGERIKGIFINKTGKFYPRGQFVADILYQGYQFNKNLINVSGLALVCDWKKKLNESCARVILEKHEYHISGNDTVVLLNASFGKAMIDDSIYEKGENGSVLLCFLNPTDSFGEKYHIEMDFTQAYVSYILSWISITAMIVVLATYSFFPTLRNLPGCNTMNLTFSLLIMQITYIFGQRNTVTGTTCKAVAIVLHYEILCCFMWMHIMAFDLFKTFGSKTVLNNIRSKGKYLPRYMLYAYGTPSLVILTTFLLDYFLVDSELSPHYGKHDICWITNREAAIAYFATPLAIIMCVNLTLFILTIRSIRNVKHILNVSHQKKKQSGKSDVLLYARMAFVIGLTWALAFAAAYVQVESIAGKILTYLFIIFNTLQGVFIFCVFVCNRRVGDLYRGAILRMVQYISRSPIAGKSSQTLSRLANVMHRTVSKETVVSTISNSSTCSNDSYLTPFKESN